VASYHLTVKPVKRAAGRSVTAAAAYRAADRIRDQASGQVFDYTRKRGVVHAEIVLPSDAARRDINWSRDRTALWNAAESAERRKDARVAREYELALPHELTHAQRVVLVQTFAQDIANRYHAAVCHRTVR
jgi:ATP-dependent exoDNAse (exonuclease V) alpha subunit